MSPRDQPTYGTTTSKNSNSTTRHHLRPASSVPHGTTSFDDTVANLCKICVGTGVLALPYSFAQGGVLCSVFGLLLIAVWNSFSLGRLMRCEEMLERLTRRHPDSPLGSYGGGNMFASIGGAALGPGGRGLVDWTIVTMMIGVCISYQVAAAGFLASDSALSFGPYLNTVLTALVLLPISLAPDIGFLSKYSKLGLTAILTTFLVIFYHGFQNYGFSGFSDVPFNTLYPTSFRSFSHWYGVSSFCFGIAPMTFNVSHSMADPSLMDKACAKALTMVFVFYVVFGDGTLLLLTPDGASPITGDILQSLPATSLMASFVRLSMTFVCLVSFPLCMVPASEVIESKLFHSTPSNRTPFPLLVATRVALVGLCTVVAALVPSFVLVVSLIGCLSVGLVTFIFPPLFHYKLTSRLREAAAAAPASLDEGEKASLVESGLPPPAPQQESEGSGTDAADIVMLCLGVVSTVFTTGMTLASVAESVRGGK